MQGSLWGLCPVRGAQGSAAPWSPKARLRFYLAPGRDALHVERQHGPLVERHLAVLGVALAQPGHGPGMLISARLDHARPSRQQHEAQTTPVRVVIDVSNQRRL